MSDKTGKHVAVYSVIKWTDPSNALRTVYLTLNLWSGLETQAEKCSCRPSSPSMSYDSSIASSKASSPHSAI
jgi:hypothetical protein